MGAWLHRYDLNGSTARSEGNPHQTKQYFVLANVHKAYDSVSQEATWTALKMLGVLDAIIEIVKSFHNGVKARVRVDRQLLDEIEVNNSLRQSCTMAPHY